MTDVQRASDCTAGILFRASVLVAFVLLQATFTATAFGEKQTDIDLVEELYATAAASMFADDLRGRLQHATLDIETEKQVLLPMLQAARESGDKETIEKLKIILIGLNQRFFYKQFQHSNIPGYEKVDVLNEINLRVLQGFDKFDPTRELRFTSWCGKESWRTPVRLKKKRFEKTFVEDLVSDPDEGSATDFFFSTEDTTLESREEQKVLTGRLRMFNARIRTFLRDPRERVSERNRLLMEVSLFHRPQVTQTELAAMTGHSKANISGTVVRVMNRIEKRYKKNHHSREFKGYLAHLQHLRRANRQVDRSPREAAELMLSPEVNAFAAAWRRQGVEDNSLWEKVAEAIANSDLDIPEDLRRVLELYLFHEPRLTQEEVGKIFGYTRTHAKRRIDSGIRAIGTAFDFSGFYKDSESFELSAEGYAKRVFSDAVAIIGEQKIAWRSPADRKAVEKSPIVARYRVAERPIGPDYVAMGLAKLPESIKGLGLSSRQVEIFDLYYRSGKELSVRAVAEILQSTAPSISSSLGRATKLVVDWLTKNGHYGEVDVSEIQEEWKNNRALRKIRGKAKQSNDSKTEIKKTVPVSSEEQTNELTSSHYRRLAEFVLKHGKRLPALASLSPTDARTFELRYLQSPPMSATEIATLLDVHPKSLQKKLRKADGPLVKQLIANGIIGKRDGAALRNALSEYRKSGRLKKNPDTLAFWLLQKAESTKAKYASPANTPSAAPANKPKQKLKIKAGTSTPLSIIAGPTRLVTLTGKRSAKRGAGKSKAPTKPVKPPARRGRR